MVIASPCRQALRTVHAYFGVRGQINGLPETACGRHATSVPSSRAAFTDDSEPPSTAPSGSPATRTLGRIPPQGVVGRKSFYTGQCPEWGHPLDEALIVRWIGLHFFFSFELSYLRAPRKPRLDVAPVARHENLLLYAVSLCRMVVCGPERPAAPPQ